MLDITTLEAWGEFIGGIAVVVSLVYLASQIRQNSKLMRVSTAAVASGSVASLELAGGGAFVPAKPPSGPMRGWSSRSPVASTTRRSSTAGS